MASVRIPLKSLCIYCYKPSTEENCPVGNPIGLQNGSQEHAIFIKLISRHLQLSRKNTACLENCSPKPCNDCLGIVNKFCELYHQLKCLELQVNWQVDKLWNVMRWADRVPSRLKSYRNTENFERRLEFRKIFKRKCRRHFLRQSPRLILPVTLPVAVQPKTGTEIKCQDVIRSSDVEFTDISTTTGNAISSQQDQDKKTEHNILLGWISSLAALIFLYHLNIPHSQNIEDDMTVEPTNFVTEEPDSIAPVIVEPQSQPSPEDENDCDDDVVSSTGCYEPQQFPCNSSTNHDDSNCVNDIPAEEEPISENVVPSAAPTVPLFMLEETAQLLSSDFNVDCYSSSQGEVPVRMMENQLFSNQESRTPENPEESVTPVALESENDPNIEIGDVKLAFSSASLEYSGSKNMPVTSTSSSSSYHKRMTANAHEEETSGLGRRSLRTKFQCSKCKATFSDVKRFENHSNSCSQACGMESEIDSDEEEKAVVKIDADLQPHYQDSDDSLPNERTNLSYAQRRIKSRTKTKPINCDSDRDDDWETPACEKYESESSLGSGNESFGEEKNYQLETDTDSTTKRVQRLPRRHVHSCTKCDLTFRNRTRLYFHENYKHAKDHLDTFDMGKMHLTRSCLKLEGISLETCFKCTLDPDQCTRKYPLSKELEKHIKLHGQFNCSICDLSVTDVLDLVDHEVEHTDEQQTLKDDTFKKGDIYHCARCDYKAAVSQEIVNHYLSQHLGLPEIEAECPICQQRFPWVDTVPLTHYLNCHDLNRLDDPGDKITCNEANCTAYFIREDQLHQHWTLQHANIEIKLAEVRKLTKQKISMNKLRLERPYACRCPYCHRTFQCSRTLKRHISTEHVNKTCKSLGQRFISKDGLTVDDWVFEKNAKFFCKINGCKEKFREEKAFQIHSKLHGEFPCNFCEVVKTFATDLAIHELVHVDKLAEVKTISNPQGMRFRCSRCPFRTGKKDRHVGHFVWKHLGLLVDQKKCPTCKHGFKTSYNHKNSIEMIKHLKLQIYEHFIDWHDFTGVEGGENVALKCDKCPAYFRTSLQLIQHTDEVHDSPGPNSDEIEGAVCKDCGMVLSSVKSLRRHRVLVHKVELRFLCDVAECGEKFETARLLVNHHTFSHNSRDAKGERSFVCEQCGKTYFTKTFLVSHMKCHKLKKVQPAKSHVCEQCGKAFKDKPQLETHYKFHKGPESWDFTCEVCDKKIFSQQKLTEHMRVHTKEKPFKCQVCGMAYGHRHNLRIHVNSKHKEIQDVPRNIDTTNFASSRKGKKIK